MPEESPPPRWVKPTTDYAPLVAFFAVYQWNDDLLTATAALMIATAIVLVVARVVAGRIPKFPLVMAGAVVFFGGLTLWFDDPVFIKVKPTIVQALIAGVLLGGLAFGKPLLKPVLGTSWEMGDDGWRQLTRRFGLFFVAMAVLNEIVWRTQPEHVWVNFKVFGIAGLALVFTICQMPMLRRHFLAAQAEKQG